MLFVHSTWEDQGHRCANKALPVKASQCQYENSCKPAPLISHTVNEILALGIPRYTCSQLVRTAFFWANFILHWVSLRIRNVPRVYFTKIISIVQFAAWLNHHELVSIYIWLPYLAANWLRRQSCRFKEIFHPSHAFQGKCNKGCSTKCCHSLSATRYIPHSPVSWPSLVTLHSSVSSHRSVSLHSSTSLHSPWFHTAP